MEAATLRTLASVRDNIAYLKRVEADLLKKLHNITAGEVPEYIGMERNAMILERELLGTGKEDDTQENEKGVCVQTGVLHAKFGTRELRDGAMATLLERGLRASRGCPVEEAGATFISCLVAPFQGVKEREQIQEALMESSAAVRVIACSPKTPTDRVTKLLPRPVGMKYCWRMLWGRCRDRDCPFFHEENFCLSQDTRWMKMKSVYNCPSFTQLGECFYGPCCYNMHLIN